MIAIMPARKIRVLDLFAGAGGLTAGFQAASDRFTSVAAVEMDTAAAASYEATFGVGIVFAGSIQDWLETAAMPHDVDIIVGGPPCQGFSTLGKQDVEDERNSLWMQYAETIRRIKPKYFVVENVAAFARSPQFSEFLNEVTQGSLQDYSVEHRILNAADFGAPQARKRAVMIGHRRDVSAPGFPLTTHGQSSRLTVRSALNNVAAKVSATDLPADRSIEFRGRRFAGPFAPSELHLGRNYTKLSLDRFAHIPAGGNRFDIPDPLLPACWRNHKSGTGDVMGRLHWDMPSVTIRTEFFKPEKGRYLHPTEHRAITHYEAALLQGFPQSHKFVGSKTSIARQIGNAVPIPLGAAIARQLEAQFPQ
jgi:DNA (cytosine-5)-methyltransferase 1